MSPKKNVTELSNKEKIDVIHHILDIFWDKAGDVRSYNDVQEDLNDHNYECDTHLCDLIPEAYNRIHDLEDTDEFIDCGEGPKLIPELEDERPPSIPNDDTTTPWWHEEDIESRVEVLENMKRKIQKKMASAESSGEPTELKDLKEEHLRKLLYIRLSRDIGYKHLEMENVELEEFLYLDEDSIIISFIITPKERAEQRYYFNINRMYPEEFLYLQDIGIDFRKKYG